MRSSLRSLLVLASLLAASAAGAQTPTPTPTVSSDRSQDPVLAGLIQEAIQRNPDLAEARSLVAASRERIPQAKALPDPSLSLGLQNDGFHGLQVGKMPTSYYQIVVTQPLPWPGKRDAREKVAALGVRVQDAALARTRLTLLADLERAYVGLVLVREQLGLLDQQAAYLQQAEGSARVRYQVGKASQTDLLRAQLEQTRLQQTRLDLQAQEASLLASLNRIRVEPSTTPLATPATLETLPPPPLATEQAWMQRAEAGSPDLAYARRTLAQSEQSLDLAKLDVRPDFAVSAGLMPRGGLDPMWQVSVSIGLPIYAHQKQQRAVAEQTWRKQASGQAIQSVKTLLRQRIRERLAALGAAEASARIYREGLLVQSEATFQSAMAQYEAGKIPFLSVLEALNGWVSDRSSYLSVLAQAQAQQIALRSYDLGPAPAITAASLGSPSLALGAGATSSASTPSSASSM